MRLVRAVLFVTLLLSAGAVQAASETRLIIDESGGSRAPWGSHVYLPYSSEPTPMIDRRMYRSAPVNQRDSNHLLTYGEADRVTLISEVGYGGAPNLVDNVLRYPEHGNTKTPDYRFRVRLLDSLNKLLGKHELRGMFPDSSAFCLATQKLQATGTKLHLEALRLNPKVGGVAQGTRFHDSSSAANANGFVGLIDDFRLYNRALTDAEIAILANPGLLKYGFIRTARANVLDYVTNNPLHTNEILRDESSYDFDKNTVTEKTIRSR